MIHRVDQYRSGSAAPDLDQVGAVGVPEARGALGIDGERAAARGQLLCSAGDFVGAGGKIRQPLGRLQQGVASVTSVSDISGVDISRVRHLRRVSANSVR